MNKTQFLRLWALCSALLVALVIVGAPPAKAGLGTAVVVGGTTAANAANITPALGSYDQVRVVPYPASVWFPTYDMSVAEGIVNLRRVLAETTGPVTVIGYSQGARIVGDVLSEPQRAGVTGVVYADPRRAGHGIETQLPFDLPGATMSGERAPFTVPVRSVCNQGDGVCDWRNGDPIGSIMGYFALHTAYQFN